MNAIIYKIESGFDGKVYVGSTVSLKNRWKCHRGALRRGDHHSRHLQSAWNLRGEGNFRFVVLWTGPVELRVEMEQKWINDLGAHDQARGYNMCPVAGSCERRPHTEETKQKIRAAHVGRPKSAIHRARVSEGQRGRITSSATREKLSAALRGKRLSPEQIQRGVEARKGFRHSDETKEALRLTAKGRVATADTRAKLSRAGTGRTWSESTRAKMAQRAPVRLSTECRRALSVMRGGRPFKVTDVLSGNAYVFCTLGEVASLGLNASNVHKCLIGKAKSTKGYRCQYHCP